MMNRLTKVVLILSLLCGVHGVSCSGWLSGDEAHASTIQLPKTGQTGCWDAAGGVIACAATGQDGDKLKGIAPPAPRFTDNGNGTVTDNQTGLIWLKNANCFGTQVWATALTSANTLANAACGLTDSSVAGDWRLPNRKELQSLIDRQNVNPALPTGHPFSNVQANDYWSASSYVDSASNAWYVIMSGGSVSYYVKSHNVYVWPVRAGQVGNSLISASPASKDFGSITVGATSAAQTFTIGNSGSALVVSNIATTGGASAMFTIAPGDGTGGTCGSLTPTIALGASCTVSVAFTPSSGLAKSTTLRISSNDPVAPNKDIALTGTGVFTICTGVTGSGSITCAPSATVNQGASTTCTATPDAGNYVASATVDSVAVPAAANTASYAQLFSNVTAAHTMTATFNAKINQTITFNPATKTYGDAPFNLSTLASGGGSGNAVTFALVSGPGSLSGANNATLTINGAGNIVLRASQAGSVTHNAATDVQQTITVNKATATVTLGSLAATYDGTAKNATATTNPAGKTVTFTYDGNATAPTNAGSYAVVGTISDSNYQGTGNGTLNISKAAATVTLGSLAATYDSTDKSATATTNPVGKTVTFTYDGSATAPTNAGSYAVVGTINDSNYQGSASGSLVIGKATATVTLGSLFATFDNMAKNATATTNPVGKAVTFTYDGSTTAPANAGSYAVIGTINDSNYQGSASGSLVIGKAISAITWNNPAAITYGTALSDTQLNATANIPGTFVYSPASGNVPSTGAQTLSVTFTPTDSVNFTSAAASVSLTVANQTFTVTPSAGAGSSITLRHSAHYGVPASRIQG